MPRANHGNEKMHQNQESLFEAMGVADPNMILNVTVPESVQRQAIEWRRGTRIPQQKSIRKVQLQNCIAGEGSGDNPNSSNRYECNNQINSIIEDFQYAINHQHHIVKHGVDETVTKQEACVTNYQKTTLTSSQIIPFQDSDGQQLQSSTILRNSCEPKLMQRHSSVPQTDCSFDKYYEVNYKSQAMSPTQFQLSNYSEQLLPTASTASATFNTMKVPILSIKNDSKRTCMDESIKHLKNIRDPLAGFENLAATIAQGSFSELELGVKEKYSSRIILMEPQKIGDTVKTCLRSSTVDQENNLRFSLDNSAEICSRTLPLLVDGSSGYIPARTNLDFEWHQYHNFTKLTPSLSCRAHQRPSLVEKSGFCADKNEHVRTRNRTAIMGLDCCWTGEDFDADKNRLLSASSSLSQASSARSKEAVDDITTLSVEETVDFFLKMTSPVNGSDSEDSSDYSQYHSFWHLRQDPYLDQARQNIKFDYS